MNLSTSFLNEIIQSIWDKFKLDLSEYAKSSLQRRFRQMSVLNGIQSEDEFREFILKQRNKDKLIEKISVSTTEMFRDPGLWLFIRNHLLKQVSRLPELDIWHAGCSSGEEVISLQILLKECGFKNKARTVASDFNADLLDKTKKATYLKRNFDLYETNYLKAGGKTSLQNYLLKEDPKHITFLPELTQSLRVEKFDLVLDYADETFDLIFCRNVLIYFNAALQEKVLRKLVYSLKEGGFLILGHNESIYKKETSGRLNNFHAAENIYQLKSTNN